MAGVYLNIDDVYQYFVWDESVLDILNKDKHLELIELPDELVAEYKDLMTKMEAVQLKLKVYFHEKNK